MSSTFVLGSLIKELSNDWMCHFCIAFTQLLSHPALENIFPRYSCAGVFQFRACLYCLHEVATTNISVFLCCLFHSVSEFYFHAYIKYYAECTYYIQQSLQMLCGRKWASRIVLVMKNVMLCRSYPWHNASLKTIKYFLI